MNNRQTLYLLMGLVALTGVGRLWTGSRLAKYEAGVTDHRREYRMVFETVDELRVRRPDAVVTEDESGVISHFQMQAQTARVGVVRVQSRERPRNTFKDISYTIEFEDGPPRLTREQIANFLFNSTLPRHMPRMRTTSLTVSPATSEARRRSLPTGAERADVWEVSSLVFTRRTPTARGE